MKDKVSIIVPVYKVEKYLNKCIDSLINQTYKNLEIILVDDGSPDNCGKICDDYARKDNRIIVIHKSNEGVSKARNKGIEIATGKYIAFVDSDDYVNNDYILDMIKVIKEKKVQLVVSNYNFITNKKITQNKSKVTGILNNEESKKGLFNDSYLVDGYCWNKLFVNKILKKNVFDTNIKICEDLLFIYNYLNEIEKIYVIDSYNYNYRLRKNSALNSTSTQDLTVFNALNEMYKDNYDNQHFKNFYCYFYIKYKKILKKNKIDIKYNFNFNNIIFNRNISKKNKILYLINSIIPNKIKIQMKLYRQKHKGYFE